MVSFSCESCNDVLPKKKVDAHRNVCWNATFTCLDCMQHFGGTDYRGHTSCISEAQKYHGAKHQSSRSRASRPESQYGRQAYVEDAPDQDTGAIVIVDAPPQAPSPPPPPAALAAPPELQQQRQSPQRAPAPPTVNVFDFLVNEDTPNASRTNVALPEVSMDGSQEVTHITVAPPEPARPLQSILDRNDSRETFGESRYAENGFHYGEGPVPVMGRPSSTEQSHAASYLTPASQQDYDRARPRTKDRKRKRVQVEELHIPAGEIGTMRGEGDEIMIDAPPVLHSGLTGGLKSLLSSSRPADYPPSPDYSSGGAGELGDPSPGSPLKRSKRHSIIRNPMTALVPARRRSTHHNAAHHVTEVHHQSTHRLRRQHRHRHGANEGDGHEARHERRHHRRDRDADMSDRNSPPPVGAAPARRLKVIKYRTIVAEQENNSNDSGSKERRSENNINHRHSSLHRSSTNSQLVVYRSRADLFMSFVNKGPESEKGCSINKALKRYHRERGTSVTNGNGGPLAKSEEEKELWKSLRLRKNDRGEIVLFAAGAPGANGDGGA